MCRCNICGHKNIMQREVPTIPQQLGLAYPVYYRGTKRRWIHSFLGHIGGCHSLTKSVTTTVYRKPTHTDVYLQWDSHHNLAAKLIVINTLTRRAKTVCFSSQLLKEEEDHLRQALIKCKYLVCALNMANIQTNRSSRGSSNIRNNTTTNINKPYMVVPYMKGLSESCKICSKFVTQMHFKGGTTMKDLLVKPKDRDTILQKSGVMYR